MLAFVRHFEWIQREFLSCTRLLTSRLWKHRGPFIWFQIKSFCWVNKMCSILSTTQWSHKTYWRFSIKRELFPLSTLLCDLIFISTEHNKHMQCQRKMKNHHWKALLNFDLFSLVKHSRGDWCWILVFLETSFPSHKINTPCKNNTIISSC